MKLPAWFYRLRNLPVHLIALGLIRLVRILPEDRAYALGAALGSFTYRMMPRWRKTALRNLELLYSNQLRHCVPSLAERELMAADSARHLAWEVIEFIRMGVLPVEQGLAMVVETQGEEELRKGLESGKGVIVIGMHYGNWELTGAYIASRIVPMHAVGKAQQDEFLTRLAFPWRAKYGMRNIFAGRQQGSAILRALRENTALGLVSDQNGGKAGTFAPFCGIPASCVTGAANLALKTGAPMVTVYSRRIAPGRHRWGCLPPVDMRGLPEDRAAATVELLTRINAGIERVVLSDPAQWLLGHKRWKTRPPGEAPLYR